MGYSNLRHRTWWNGELQSNDWHCELFAFWLSLLLRTIWACWRHLRKGMGSRNHSWKGHFFFYFKTGIIYGFKDLYRSGSGPSRPTVDFLCIILSHPPPFFFSFFLWCLTIQVINLLFFFFLTSCRITASYHLSALQHCLLLLYIVCVAFIFYSTNACSPFTSLVQRATAT